MGYLTILSLQHGIRAGFVSIAGIACGLLTVGLLSVVGMAACIDRHPELYELLRLAGTLYLLWIAYDSWRDVTHLSTTTAGVRPNISAYRHFFWRGVAVNLLNPKAAAFYLTVLPGFVTASASSGKETLLFTGLYAGIATAVHALIVVFASRFSAAVAAPNKQKFIRRTMALLLVAVAVWFMVSSARA